MTPHALRAHRPWFGTHEPLQTIGLPPLLKKRSPIAEDKCPLAGGNASNSALHDPLRQGQNAQPLCGFPQAELMEWPAPPSGVVGSPAIQEEEGMDISVLGIDLGKNVCSVVGLDASGAVVMRRKVRRETLIALAEKLPPCVVGMEACCGAHHLGRVFAATATTSG